MQEKGQESSFVRETRRAGGERERLQLQLRELWTMKLALLAAAMGGRAAIPIAFGTAMITEGMATATEVAVVIRGVGVMTVAKNVT